MKKRAFILLLVLLLTCSVTAQAGLGDRFYRHFLYGSPSSYENMVYHYGLDIFDRFQMLSDEALEQIWAEREANAKEGDDALYDFRIWISPDEKYEFEVQVKEPTYDSFETELEMAPRYLELISDGFSPENNVRMIHEGKLRSTKAGKMLETAIAYDVSDGNDGMRTVVFMYYDLYAGATEYCFSLHAYDGDYETAQDLLDEICQTVRLSMVKFKV